MSVYWLNKKINWKKDLKMNSQLWRAASWYLNVKLKEDLRSVTSGVVTMKLCLMLIVIYWRSARPQKKIKESICVQ